ncbi:CvpA family protein [Gammaproteobacteria bacterium]|jgi:membrane protein required for colicin V production|nr:CvpA family protein [Gammaproteobacteria bacterium]MDA9094393.1 CvpA family protein [Gammaproteobacteria bacterium]MDA9112600.1 CvpA family protein [Gammaproteobacteria bacterium]MDB4252966.1 CvpA family protein [Gammaproteobacteria bacterium]MDC1190940.1 CvpA family protein [Gammaproteobacteria bacterium]|tara:strand:+ start:384 stop:923 length:540 start_codon:yes stop_codon:yes gene_type:complete
MEALGLNITDWTILVIVTISGIISLFRGFTKEFLSLFLWVFSFLTAISLEYLVSPFISSYIGNPEISKIGAYIVIFVACIFAGGIVINMISKLIKWSGVSGFDKFLGVLFGMGRGLIVIFIIFLLMPSGLKNSDLMLNSKISPFIEKIAPQIEAYIRDLMDNDALIEVKDLIDTTEEEA